MRGKREGEKERERGFCVVEYLRESGGGGEETHTENLRMIFVSLNIY